MTGLGRTSVHEAPENLLHSLFPLAPEGELPVRVHTGVWFQSYLGLAVWSRHRRWEHGLSSEEGVTILLLQPDPQCQDLGALIRFCLGFPGHLDH